MVRKKERKSPGSMTLELLFKLNQKVISPAAEAAGVYHQS